MNSDEPATGRELDFATAARVGMAACLDRVDLMVRRGVAYDEDVNDIRAMCDACVGEPWVVQRAALDDLHFRVMQMLVMPEDAVLSLSAIDLAYLAQAADKCRKEFGNL